MKKLVPLFLLLATIGFAQSGKLLNGEIYKLSSVRKLSLNFYQADGNLLILTRNCSYEASLESALLNWQIITKVLPPAHPMSNQEAIEYGAMRANSENNPDGMAQVQKAGMYAIEAQRKSREPRYLTENHSTIVWSNGNSCQVVGATGQEP